MAMSVKVSKDSGIIINRRHDVLEGDNDFHEWWQYGDIGLNRAGFPNSRMLRKTHWVYRCNNLDCDAYVYVPKEMVHEMIDQAYKG